MKLVVLMFLFLIISNCAVNKKVFWCGDHPCVNNAEKKLYFKENMIVEVKKLNKKKIKKFSNLEKITQQAKLNEKKIVKNEKAMIKQEKLEAKRRIELEDEEIAKRIERDYQSQQIEQKVLNKKSLADKNIVEEPISLLDKDSDFKKLTEKIVNKNTSRPYPDINDIPN